MYNLFFCLAFIGICLFLGCAKIEDAVNPDNSAEAGEQSETAVVPLPVVEANAKETIDGDKLKNNPFLTSQEEKVYANTGKYVPIDYLNLSAIIYSSASRRAIVDGNILEIGNTIDNKKVIDIRPEEIILKDSQSEYVLRLKKVAAE